MIITKEIRKEVTQYNLRIFKNFGFKIGENAIVPIEKWDINSHEKIDVSCDICNKMSQKPYRQYMSSLKKYGIYSCSSKCSHFKNKLTNKEQYGCENYNNRNKYKNTCIEKYGVDNIFKSKDIIDKIDKVKRHKYGQNFELITEKMKKSMLKIYGVDNISKLSSIKEIKKETTFKNYGVHFFIQCKFGYDKMRETNISRGNWFKYDTGK